MRIVAISDLHGFLHPDVPPADLVLIAGDVCPDFATPAGQAMWLRDEFSPWAEQLRADAVVMCWGNHDFVGQLPAHELPPLPVEVVTDRAVTVKGVTLYGTPWTRTVPGVWAFDVEVDELASSMDAIPIGIDILITHGPPFGVLDRVVSGHRVGVSSADSHAHSPLEGRSGLRTARSAYGFPRANRLRGWGRDASARGLVLCPMGH